MMMNIVLVISVLVVVQSFSVQNKRVNAYIKKGNLMDLNRVHSVMLIY